MNICIVGGSGFVGTYLIRHFLNRQYSVFSIGKRSRLEALDDSGLTYLSADTNRPGSWQEKVRSSDVIINLAGASIFQRWTAAAKKTIRDSRILTTRNITDALPSDRKTLLINASGIGYYGDRGEDRLEETEPAGNDFLAHVSSEWEKAASTAPESTRVVTTRLGVVLGTDGGALAKMLPAFKWYAGGPLGSGNQWFPWIHIEDLTSAFLFLIDREPLQGPLNFCAPQPVRNREFVNALGKTLGRPAVLKAPAFVLRTVLGEFASVLLGSQKAVPARLIDAGFRFRFPEIVGALQDLAGDPPEKKG